MSLDQTTLNAKSRNETGKGVSRRLRTDGLVPAVIYGKGLTPVSLSVDPIALRKALATPHKFNTVITVKLEGQPDRLVLLKDYQHHPVTRKVLHADFQEVKLDQPVKVDVPVVLSGKAQGVGDGGILTQILRELEVLSLPGAIPAQIEIDVTPLKINESLHEADVKLPEGVKLAGRKNLTIAVVSAPEGEAAPAAAAAAAAPAAGAKAAAPAAGAKAAAPAAAGKAAPAAAAKPAAKK